jgi:hypothetical protein
MRRFSQTTANKSAIIKSKMDSLMRTHTKKSDTLDKSFSEIKKPDSSHSLPEPSEVTPLGADDSSIFHCILLTFKQSPIHSHKTHLYRLAISNMSDN